jgi:SAM-dependent methyltransferase
MCSSEQREVLADLRASDFTVRNNETYRTNCFELLGISPDDTYPLAACNDCGFCYSPHLPSKGFLRIVYENAIDHDRTITETISYRRRFLEKLAIVLGELDDRPKKLLDFGCGYGHALRILQMRDLRCFGFDISVERLRQAGLAATNDVQEVRERGPFDVILCFDVLEHVSEPNEALEFLAAVSAPGGILAINVPDCSGMSTSGIRSAIQTGAARAINPWEHLNYFTPASLHAALRRYGFIPYRNIASPPKLGFAEEARGLGLVRNAVGVGLRRLRYREPLGTEVVCHRVLG